MKFLEQSLDKQNQVWKYILTLFVAFIVANFLGALPLAGVIFYKYYTSGGDIVFNPNNITDFSGLGISQNLGLILLMLPMVIGLFAVIFMLKLLHRRSFAETVNGTKSIRWNRCGQGFIGWSILMAIYLVIEILISPDNFVLQFDLVKFIPLLFISLIIIPFQTTFEEIIFRGYLAQGIAGWTKNRWLAFIIPAVLFGLMHYANPEVKEYGFWATMPQYIYFGLFFGLISVLDDGIELAMGIHAANNIFYSLFITNAASVLQTPAVFEQLSVNPFKETLVLIITSLLLIFYFYRKYNWNLNILNKKVEIEENI